MLSLRIHLDHAPESNGALRVLPGTHQYARLDTCQIHYWKGTPDNSPVPSQKLSYDNEASPSSLITSAQPVQIIESEAQLASVLCGNREEETKRAAAREARGTCQRYSVECTA